MPYHENIEKLTRENSNFRQVIYTGKKSQLVLMSLPPKGEIGEETHNDVDQILFFVQGRGESILEGVSKSVSGGDVVFVPAGTLHNFKNADMDDDLKLFTVYSPPEHPDGKIHKTKAEAEADRY